MTDALIEQGGSFFSRTPARIFTVEDFDSDERLMIQTAEQFSRGEVLPLIERLEAQEEGLMPGLIRKAGELGFCGVDTAEAFGGLGLSKNLAARILEFLSLNASFSVTIGVTSGIGQFGLVGFGNEEQKARFLPKLTAGEWMAAYCLSEPNSGSDALSISTRAEQQGDEWVLNGTKMWISNAKWAHVFIVMAKIGGEKFSAFLVERGTPGLTIEREEHKLGLKGSSTARVTLENVRIPLSNLLYEPGLGHHVAFNALNLGRFKLSSMSLGPARAALESASDYSVNRRQFGRPVGDFGLMRRKFAEMAARFYGAESVIYRTGALIDTAFHSYAGDIPGNRKAAEEFAIECSAGKVLSTEAEAYVVDECVQVYGGYGFTEEFPVARHFRDARVSRIYEGTNEINRVFLADRLIRKAKDGKASLVPSGDSFVSELAGMALATDPQGQIALGACSDLILLAYAEQSARLRANQVGGLGKDLYAVFANWVDLEAARAFAVATGKGTTIPDPRAVDLEALGGAVLEARGPIRL